MPFSYYELFFGGTRFCCCLPVRFGVISMTILGMLFSGVLSIVLWFEVSSTIDMTPGEKACFVVAGFLETALFIASILGFVGAVVRKQLFVQIYTYAIYVHCVLNLAASAALLYMVTRFSSNATTIACQDTITDSQTQQQCEGLLHIATAIYWTIVSIVVIIELYGALIVTRYLNQLKREKYSARASQYSAENAFKLIPTNSKGYSSLFDGADPYTPSHARVYSVDDAVPEFDPYREAGITRHESVGAAPPVEVGYGGGSWTHEDITAEEKARLRRQDREMGIETEPSEEDEAQRTPRPFDIKTTLGPSSSQYGGDVDDLPQYTGE